MPWWVLPAVVVLGALELCFWALARAAGRTDEQMERTTPRGRAPDDMPR
jgi:hypothetical protein